MPHKKTNRESSDLTSVKVKKEMAKPRMAHSVQVHESVLDPSRASEPPSTTVPGTVDKIIAPTTPSIVEKAQIAVDGDDNKRRNIRIENSLTDEHGDEVRLKKGAHVEVTVAAQVVKPRIAKP